MRYFDPDEFEHSHAAWCVFKGLLPYRDFFEHHTPWFYYALAPFFRWFAVDQSFDSARHFLLFARGVSLVLSALSVFLVVLMGRLGARGHRVGLVAGLFMASQPVMVQKTLEIRPDVMALPFFLGGLWFLMRALRAPDGAEPRRIRGFGAGGLCVGAAIMCTQKMLFVLPGLFAGLALWAVGGHPRWSWRRLAAVLAVLAGATAPGALTWAGFALRGAGDVFVQNNFLLNAGWRLRTGRNVLETLQTAWPVAALSVVGAAAILCRLVRPPRRPDGDVLLLCTLGGLLAGVAVIPVPYAQYYLMPLGVACVIAARGLQVLVDLAPHRARPWLVIGAMVTLSIWPLMNLKRSFTYRDGGQMARLRYVLEHTAPEDTVMDGWLGTGVFRPHAFYYFFMHPELRAMLPKNDRDDYEESLENGKIRPALIALDGNLASLGPRFVGFVRRNHVTADGLFYRPAHAHPVAIKRVARFRACPPAGRADTPRSPETFRTAVARMWESCHYTSVGGEDGDPLGTMGDGIEIKPDGRYWHVARDTTGKLVGIPGPDSEGSITYGTTYFGAVQTTFRSDLGQTLIAAPVITATPTLLIIKTANADHRYVAVN